MAMARPTFYGATTPAMSQSGAKITQAAGVGNAPINIWRIVETGDFNGDGMSDILWQDISGSVAIWFMNAAQVMQAAALAMGACPALVDPRCQCRLTVAQAV
jgi:hypothetical protein